MVQVTQVDAIQEHSTPTTVKRRINIIKARESLYYTREVLANKMGVEVQAVKGWENGKHKPYLRHIEKLRGILRWTDTDEELLRVFEVSSEASLKPEEEPQDALELMEEPQDAHEPTKDSLTLDELRRKTIEFALKAAGITFLPGTAILSAPIIGPDEYLAQCSIAIDDCWQKLNHGDDTYKIERSLHAHLPTLAKYANTESAYACIAAELAMQATVMQMIIATGRLDYAARRKLGLDAVRYGRISGNPFSLVVAEYWHGDTYIYLTRQPDKAIKIFNDALAGLTSEAELGRSSIYIGLAIAYAQLHDETQALDYAKMARDSMPSRPELDPSYPSIPMGQSELDQLAGKAYLYLAEHFSDYGKLAYETFNLSISKQATAPGFRGQALIRKADAAIAINEMDEYESSLREGLAIAIRINSRKRFAEIHDVVSRLPAKWQRDTAIQNLVNDIAEAKTNLIAPA